MVTNALGEGDLEVSKWWCGRRLSGCVKWFENTKEGIGCGEQCGTYSSWIIGLGEGCMLGLLEDNAGKVSWCKIKEGLSYAVLQNYF